MHALDSATQVLLRSKMFRTGTRTSGVRRSTAAIELLLANGANVHATDVFGETALMMAARAGRADVVRVLIRAQADVNAKAKRGETALSGARYGGYVGVVRLLKRAGA